MSSPAVSRYPLIEHPPRQPSPPAHRATAARSSAAARLTGRFRYDRSADAWWWSAEMFTLHGLAPGSPPPDTEAYLQYQHPEDRARVLEALSRACETGQDFALETRTVRADGEKRDVVLVGECRSDDGTAIAAVEGLAVDITECHPPGSPTDRAQALEAEVGQLRAAMASRASIEQAKGILMLLTSCSEQVAFELLAHMSSHTHRKVREVAQAIVDSASGAAPLPEDVKLILHDACPPPRRS